MNELTNHALAAIENYRNNKIIMDFVTNEALEKVASDIREKTNSGTTAKGVEVLLMNGNDKSIKCRFDEYVELGLIGCYMAYLNCGH